MRDRSGLFWHLSFGSGLFPRNNFLLSFLLLQIFVDQFLDFLLKLSHHGIATTFRLNPMDELMELFVEESRPAHWDHPLNLLANVDVAVRQAAQIIRALPRSNSLPILFAPRIRRVVS